MRRAIVWLCWGAEFVRQATESAGSAAAMAADRFLITDAEGAAEAAEGAEFTGILRVELRYRNNLEKSRLLALVPDGYESFLYLDPDTRIVGDVSLGFHKAEQHGIALVPAPNCNLAEYFGSDRTAEELGIAPADQMIYNAGVIFFRLTFEMRQVLTRWNALCEDFGPKLPCPSDQLFLTLALEQLGVVPYVLSPLYNYRGLGEYAVGRVRIWHSHVPPPPDLNAFELARPPRHFKDGARIHLDAEAALPAAALRIPESMVRLALPEFSRGPTPPATEALIGEALSLQRERGSSAANEFLIKQIGIETSEARNEPYFAEGLHYLLGLLYAHASDPEQMAHHLALSRTMPGAEDDLLFSDHVNESRVLRATQQQAISHGMPPILIACMPRSASATLAHSLAQAIAAPVLHLSAGRFPDNFLVPSWLDMFLEGGALTQDHFGATAFNLGVLCGRGSRDVFVLIRDPRAAARSQVHFLLRGREPGEEGLESAIERECVANFIPWLQGWLDCARDPAMPLRIHWITFPEVRDDLPAVARRIGKSFHKSHPAMSRFADCRNIAKVTVHFETGNDQAWRTEVGDATRSRLWDACSPEIRSLLHIEP